MAKWNPGLLRVYLAAKYDRRQQLIDFAGKLPDSVLCVSSWLNDERELASMDAFNKYVWARIDDRDVLCADVLIFWSDDEPIRGGKATEMGMALRQGSRVIVIGRHEQIFHSHPLVTVVTDEDDALTLVKSASQKLKGLLQAAGVGNG